MLEILETERLLLRPPEARDIAVITVHLAEYDIAKMMARVPHPYRRTDAEAFIKDAAKKRAEGTAFAFIIARRRDGFCMGGIGVGPPVVQAIARVFEIGYWLAKPYWGMGYATEAGRAIIAFAFEELKAERLLAGHAYDNPASGRVLKKLGFVETHRQPIYSAARGGEADCHRLALTRDAFAADMI
jgi:RimJ/RimL family protein N-acetyltransferase